MCEFVCVCVCVSYTEAMKQKTERKEIHNIQYSGLIYHLIGNEIFKRTEFSFYFIVLIL